MLTFSRWLEARVIISCTEGEKYERRGDKLCAILQNWNSEFLSYFTTRIKFAAGANIKNLNNRQFFLLPLLFILPRNYF